MMKKFRNECNAMLQNVTFDETHVHAVHERIARCSRTVRRPRCSRRAAVLAAAVLCASYIGASAVAQQITPNYGPFDEGDLPAWLLEQEGVPLALSETSAGWTISLDKLIADSHMVYVVGHAEPDSGGLVSNDPTAIGFREYGWTLDGETPEAWSDAYVVLPDLDPTDNSLPFALRLNTDFSDAETINMELYGFVPADNGNLFMAIPSLYSTWEFEIPLAGALQTEIAYENQTVQAGGSEWTFTDMSSSPVGFYCTVTGLTEAQYAQSLDDAEVSGPSADYVFEVQDAGEEDGVYSVTYRFFALRGTPFDLSACDTLTIAGQTFPLSELLTEA